MQEQINKYFSELCTEGFLKDTDEEIIGKAKDVIADLKDKLEYFKSHSDDTSEEQIEFIENETKDLIEEIQSEYLNEEDVIEIYIHPMTDFYVLASKNQTFNHVELYYNERQVK